MFPRSCSQTSTWCRQVLLLLLLLLLLLQPVSIECCHPLRLLPPLMHALFHPQAFSCT